MFFALSPFLLVEPLTALRDISANRQIVVDRAVAAGPSARRRATRRCCGTTPSASPVIVILAIVGAVWMSVVDWRRALLLLAFPVPFLLFIANTAPASRYLNPVLPFVALFAGWVLARLSATFGTRGRRCSGRCWPWPPRPALLASIRTDLFFRQDGYADAGAGVHRVAAFPRARRS